MQRPPRPAARVRSTADQRRGAVLRAALAQFAATGYHGTAVAAIAAAAGTSEGYVFRLFRTKQALFIAVLRDCFEQIDAAVTAAADTPGPTGSDRPSAVLEEILH